MPLKMAVFQRLKIYFLAKFDNNDFAYVLYPFVRIFKICCFAPIKLKNGAVLQYPNNQIEWDVIACIWTLVALCTYIAGFCIGVHQLNYTENWALLHNSTVITYFTSWAQIFTVFILGIVALLTSWIHLDDMRHLCALIRRIDRHLGEMSGFKIDYSVLRQRLFTEFLIAFLVPATLSMVNCVVIQHEVKINLFSSCFWFICFTPIMLVTFKEFQFYNMLFILKSKFVLINGRLTLFAMGVRRKKTRTVRPKLCKLVSISELPLTTLTTTTTGNIYIEDEQTDDVQHMDHKPSIEMIQKFIEIYSCAADGVELVLRIFSWHLLLLTTISFGIITIQSYNLFAQVMNALHMRPYQITVVVSWILVQIITIGINVSACSSTAKMMSHTGPLIHKIKMQSTNACDDQCLFYQILQLFSLEVLQRKHSFTAAGFFDMNYKLITSIIAAVTTYLVIIIQFHLTNITGQQQQQQQQQQNP